MAAAPHFDMQIKLLMIGDSGEFILVFEMFSTSGGLQSAE
jgi:hypothetical protein